jgi:hypothetical protein
MRSPHSQCNPDSIRITYTTFRCALFGDGFLCNRSQREYEALVSETDDGRLSAWATGLEIAIFVRLQELEKDRHASTERAAIKAALRALRTIQEGKLGFSKWDSAA